MRDILILSAIVLFWFTMTFSLPYYLADPLVSGQSVQGNSSVYIIEGDINITEDTVGTGQTNPKSYVDMLGRIFTFRLSSAGIPSILAVVISFINWFLILLTGLLVYRLIRHGGG